MSINEALAKAAEESTKGLARDMPLSVSTRSRTNAGSARRLDAFEAVKAQLGQRKDYISMLEIIIGWRSLHNPAKLKTAMRMYGEVTGGNYDCAMAAQSDLIARFNKWWRFCTVRGFITQRQCAIGIAAESRSFRNLAWSHNLDEKTVKSKAVAGIKIYTKIQDSRSQPPFHGERSRLPRPTMPVPRKGEALKISKIIEFRD